MSNKSETIIRLVDQGLNKNETGLAMSSKINDHWRETSVDEFREKIRHFALGLYELGLRKGDRVALHAQNCTEWLISDLAILSLGAVNVPIYTTQPADQIRYILENSESKVYIVSGDDLFDPVKPLMKSVESVFAVVSIFGSEHKKLKSFESVLELGKKRDESSPELFDKMKSEVEPGDLASIIYTSGTTGVPKGVMLTHNNIASNMLVSIERAPFNPAIDRRLRMLSFLPLSHIFERNMDYMYLHMGYPVYYTASLDNLVNDIQTVKPHFFAAVPRLLEKVYAGFKAKTQDQAGLKKKLGMWALNLADTYEIGKEPRGFRRLKFFIADRLVYKKIRQALGGNLIGMISGGAALSSKMMNFFNGIGLYCGQGYGLTETSPVIAVSEPGDLKAGSVGRPVSGVEVKIAEDGEILTRGPNVMQGYYKMPEQTAEVLTDDGWFCTGDIGKLDEDGHLYITDRKKDLFKLSTGKYVAPQYIENRLVNSLIIEQSVVIGSDQRFCTALIVPAQPALEKRLNREVGKEELAGDEEVRNLLQDEIDKVNADLPNWEQVKKFVIISEPFTIEAGELTPTMKMKRRVIFDKYEAEIESMYGELSKEA